MKTLRRITILVVLILMGCDQPSVDKTAVGAQEPDMRTVLATTPTVAISVEESDFKPQVDVAAIQSWNDKEKEESLSWKRYQERLSAAWKKREAADTKAWRAYSTFERQELLRVREVNRQAYLDYIDAEKIEDWSTRVQLEQSVPELVAYKAAVHTKWSEYKEAAAENHKQYKSTNEKAHQAYNAELKLVHDAYSALPASSR